MFEARFASATALALALCACRGGDDGLTDATSTAAPTATSSSGAGGANAGEGGREAGGSGGNDDTFRNEASLLTWNLESYPLTANAETMVVDLLEQLAPDVVAIQEIAEEQAFYTLVERLPDYDGVLNDDPGAYIRVGLLWRTERVTVTDIETLFPDDGYAFPRPPLKARVSIDAPTPIDFVTMVLHLKAQLNAPSEARRRTACERLDAWVSTALAEGPEQDYVLIGDFNDKVTDPPQWNVFSVFLDKPDTYSFLTMPAANAGDHTYIPFESFIDHVLVTSDTLDEVGTGETEVLPLETQLADYSDLTDHRPVRTWLRWSQP